MNNSSTNSPFTFPKRNFLHSKLDEILRLWHRGSGQGSFFFSINDGEPSLQFAINLDFEDVSVQETPQHHHPQHSQHPSANLQSGMRRRKGPAKLAKNRKRAADFQAAKAAASAAAVTSFPGVGRAVGTGTGPTLPLPLSKGDYFPPPPPPATSVCTTLTSSSTTSTSNTTTAATSSSNPVNEVMNEVLTDSDDDDELLNSCARCLCGFDSRSGPAYYCPVCTKHYHLACGNEHQCVSFNFG